MMYLPNHFPDHIRQLGNLFNLSSEFPKKAIINHKQVYQQSNCHEATFQIWGMNASKEAIQYQEWNANSAQ
jgi:hypothetical protein